MRMPSICPQMPNVELKGAPSGAPFFIDGGFGRNANKMPTKNGFLYELSRDVASSQGAKPHFELRRFARETA